MIIRIIPNRQKKYIKSGNRTLNALNYNAEKGELIEYANTYAPDLKTFKEHIMAIDAMNDTVDEQNKCFHGVVSLAHSEDIDEVLINEIIGRYLLDMGYKEQPYNIHKHTDKKHTHYHFVTTRINALNGRKIDDSFENRRTNVLLNQYIKEYNLTPLEELIKGVGVIKEVDKLMQSVLRKKPHSHYILKTLTKEVGIRVEKVKKGWVIFYEDDNKGINSSLLPCLKSKNINQILNRNRYYRKEAKQIVGKNLSLMMQQQQISFKEFVLTLKKQGVRVEVSRNNGGINGLIYTYKGIKLTGSEVGAGYSWNIVSKNISVVSYAPTAKRRIVPITKRSGIVQSILDEMQKIDTEVSGAADAELDMDLDNDLDM